jgi:hypothetical protein
MQKLIISILTTALLSSCRGNEQKMISVELADSTAIEVESDHYDKPYDTLLVDYETTKQLLDILQLLPDSSMVDWDWSQKDRAHFVQCIKRDGYVVDSLKPFLDMQTLDSTKLYTGVVDGGWELNIYKALDGSVIAITNSMATGGNSLRYFDWKNGQILAKSPIELFNNELEYLWTKSNQCRENISDETYIPLWDFHFSPSKIVIDGSWGLDPKKDSSCTDGNVLVYKFNSIEKKFDLKSLRWEKYRGSE